MGKKDENDLSMQNSEIRFKKVKKGKKIGRKIIRKSGVMEGLLSSFNGFNDVYE